MLLAPGLDAILHRIAIRSPQTRLTLDHFNVDVTARDSQRDATIDSINSMADLPNVAVKISALPCQVREDYPHPSLYQRIQRAVRRFGSWRCFWGSDLSRLPGTYGQWLDAFVQATSIFGWDDQKLMLSQALADWLHWSAA